MDSFQSLSNVSMLMYIGFRYERKLRLMLISAYIWTCPNLHQMCPCRGIWALVVRASLGVDPGLHMDSFQSLSNVSMSLYIGFRYERKLRPMLIPAYIWTRSSYNFSYFVLFTYVFSLFLEVSHGAATLTHFSLTHIAATLLTHSTAIVLTHSIPS